MVSQNEESEQIVVSKTNKVSSSGAFMQSAGAKILIVGLNAATGILTARALAPTGRGELSAMILWYTLLASVFSFGVPSALTYHLRSAPRFAADLGGAALTLALVGSLLACVIGFFGLPYWIPQYPPAVLLLARIFLLNIPIAIFVVMCRAVLESFGHFTASNLSLIGPPSLTLAGLFFLSGFRHLSAANAAWCYVLAGIPPVIYMAKSFWCTVQPRFDHLGASIRLLTSYGMRAYGIDLCGTLSLYVDQALVVRILQPNLMGTYVVALSLSRMLNAFHTAVVMVLFPRCVARPASEVLELTGRAVRMTTLATGLSGAAIICAGPRILVLLYGAGYRGAASSLRILTVEVIFAGAAQVMSQAFMALSRPGVVAIFQAFGLSLTIPLMLILVPRFGIVGAATSLLLSTLSRFAFVLASFSYFLNLPCPDLIPRRTDLFFAYNSIARRLKVLEPTVAGGEA